MIWMFVLSALIINLAQSTVAQNVSDPKVAEAQQQSSLQKGDGVIIHSLLGRPELNGKSATVLNYVQESGRFSVKIEEFPAQGRSTTVGVPVISYCLALSSPSASSWLTQGASLSLR